MTELDKQLAEIAPDGNLAAVKELLARGANLNAVNEEGETGFTRAVMFSRDLDYLDALIQLGANPDVPASQGGTPLTLAVMGNNFLLVRILLEAGANPNTLAFLEDSPQTALDTAYGDYCAQDKKSEEMNLDAIVQLLIEHGAKCRHELIKK